MAIRAKKIGFIFLSLAALAVFSVTLVRAAYDSSFLSLRREKEHAPLVRVVTTMAAVGPASASGATTAVPRTSVPAPKKKEPAIATHGRLVIPSIGVDAAIEHVGLTAAGAMGTPRKLANVAWYKYGTEPGGIGSAVIAGHVENSLGLPGVFHDLSEIQVGDEIVVTGEDGARLRFTVTAKAEYPAAAAPNEEIFNSTGGRYLKLITCVKTVVNGKTKYDDRLVVTAVLS